MQHRLPKSLRFASIGPCAEDAFPALRATASIGLIAIASAVVIDDLRPFMRAPDTVRAQSIAVLPTAPLGDRVIAATTLALEGSRLPAPKVQPAPAFSPLRPLIAYADAYGPRLSTDLKAFAAQSGAARAVNTVAVGLGSAVEAIAQVAHDDRTARGGVRASRSREVAQSTTLPLPHPRPTGP